jgi:hypothetical protein
VPDSSKRAFASASACVTQGWVANQSKHISNVSICSGVGAAQVSSSAMSLFASA